MYAESEKEARLSAFLEVIISRREASARKVIVFADTRKCAADLIYNFRRCGWPVVGIRGVTRERALDVAHSRFRHSVTPILVATNVATRQQSLDGARYVVNYDCPSSAEEYSQRISHASHSKGESGVTLTFLQLDDSRCAL